ncbi:eukaryotic-like serine/threonine-protein kinase [Thermoflexales bacterium]|nr:eukaryotic-like serine/threonine-protein kinase [Thermoflexales bacterium]
MTFSSGENVGPYRIVEQLGSGGMATVFKAYHANLDRYVAIKVLHPAFKQDPNFLSRFQREARIVAKLQHPAIVPVYDFNEHAGQPYLVMRFIEGETLKARLSKGDLPLFEVVQVLHPVGEALQYAHGQGVLHRDVKPSNILLTPDGSVFLADFGLARIAQAGESTLSQDALVGTPQYISPEQARGDPDLDARTDIYSLGVVLYELLIGRVPYQADTPYAVIHDHIYAPLPLPRSIKPGFPETLERVLLKALAKERGDRYASAAELMTAFESAAQVIISEAPTQALAPEAQRSGAAAQPMVVVPPIVPVVTPLASSPAVATSGSTVPTPALKTRTPLWIGLGLAAVAIIAIMAVMVLNRDRQPPPLNPQPPRQQMPGEPPHQPDELAMQIESLQTQFRRANDLINQNQLEPAQAEFIQAAENAERLLRDRPDLPSEQRVRLHTLAGQSWLAVQQPDRAQPHFQELADLAPKEAEPLVGVALAELLRGNLDAANEVLDRAIRLNPDLNSAHLLKACALIKQNERLPALREFRQAGGAETLIKLPAWMQPVLNRIECNPERFK